MAGALFLALAAISVPYPFSFLFAVGIHELSHIAVAYLFGWGRVWRISSFTGFGICYSGMHSTLSRLCVSLSGCAVGIIISLIPILDRNFRLYSLGLSCFNLLPVQGLDGGEAFLAACEALLGVRGAWISFSIVSAVCAIILWGICVAVQLKAGANLTLLAVTLFLTVKALGTEKSSYRKG